MTAVCKAPTRIIRVNRQVVTVGLESGRSSHSLTHLSPRFLSRFPPTTIQIIFKGSKESLDANKKLLSSLCKYSDMLEFITVVETSFCWTENNRIMFSFLGRKMKKHGELTAPQTAALHLCVYLSEDDHQMCFCPADTLNMKSVRLNQNHWMCLRSRRRSINRKLESGKSLNSLFCS